MIALLGIGLSLVGIVIAIREGRLSAAAPFLVSGVALVLADVLVPGY